MIENKRIPIIVVHKGNQKYLKNCILCAQENGNFVILIGDEKNKGMCKDWTDYRDCESELFEEFQKYYVHMSSNSEVFELICFQRYFYVCQYMVSHQLKECIMIDSDALVFGEVTENLIPAGIDMGSSWFEVQEKYTWSVCPHFTYWTKRGLLDFLYFCIDSYRENEKRKLLEEKYQYHLDNQIPGGICDMTLLYLWMKQTGFPVVNFSKRKEQLVDYNINKPMIDTETYIMWERYDMKKIVFENGKPYFIRRDDGRKVPVLIIHAWGGFKKYMGILKDGKEGVFWYDLARGTAWIAKRWQKLLSLGKRRK